ncbi:MAG: TRAP transporter large permease subunit, partial [Desulfobacterales bacterium]|nr:TRAP transporter large permease subunit [Desulfobacterales bacterium]
MALFGAPVFIVLSAFGMIGFWVSDIPQAAIIVDLYNQFANNPLLYTIPLFTCAGYILAESKTSFRIFRLTKSILGLLPGGLAIVALIACAFFTAFTGASGVTIIALGGILFPALREGKYPETFCLGLLTTSGSLGLLFAPSLPVIMYGVIAETSIINLFIAGFIPGILLIGLLSIYSIYTAHRVKVIKKPFQIPEIMAALNDAKWELAIPFMVIIGLFFGFATLGEIAAITVGYALFIEIYIYKDVQLKQVPEIIRQSMSLVGGILIIMGSAYGLTNYMIDAEIPLVILDVMEEYITSKFVFLIALNIFLLIVGCILDIYSAILVVVPLILPIAASYQINPIHLGIIFLTNLEIGYMTPPVGMNLFISSFRFNRPILTLYIASIPFILILFIGLMLITYIPQLSLGLVDYFG